MAKRRNISIEAYPELKEYQWDPKSFKDNDVRKFGYLFAVNAAIMCWLNDIDISLASKFDQDHAALNIIDVDTNEDGEIVRKSIRRYNIPPDLSNIDSDIRSSWESTASKIISFNESAT